MDAQVNPSLRMGYITNAALGHGIENTQLWVMLPASFHIFVSVALLLALTANASESSLSAGTDGGLYVIEIRPQEAVIPIAKRHAWTVSIRDQDGAPTDRAPAGL